MCTNKECHKASSCGLGLHILKLDFAARPDRTRVRDPLTHRIALHFLPIRLEGKELHGNQVCGITSA